MSQYFDCTKITPEDYLLYFKDLKYLKNPNTIAEERLSRVLEMLFEESVVRDGLNEVGKAKFKKYYNIFPSMMGRHSYEEYVDIFIAVVDEIINDLNKCYPQGVKIIPPPPPPLKERFKEFLEDKKAWTRDRSITQRVASYDEDIDKIDNIINKAKIFLEPRYGDKVMDDNFLLEFLKNFSNWKSEQGPLRRGFFGIGRETYEKLMRDYYNITHTKTYYFY